MTERNSSGRNDPPSDTRETATAEPTNDGSRFDRLPTTDADRVVPERPTRTAVLDWWEERYGLRDAVRDHTFWKKGKDKIWAFAGDAPDPIAIEALGLPILRTRGHHWKPTTNAVQRFGRDAERNVIRLDTAAARRFVAGTDQEIAWDGDPGYLIAAHEYAGRTVPIGVGLWTDGELRSMVPKHRRREF